MNAAVSFRVWGTTVTLLVTDPDRLELARRALDAEIDAMGEACDRFRPDSELSRLNTRSGRPFAASPLFAETLGHALRVAAATDGAVDPTVGGALNAAGYDRDMAEVRRRRWAVSQRVRLTVRPVAGWRTVRLADGVVRTPPGVVIDLGATAKAHAADRAAARAAAATGCGVLVSLGGDIAVGGPPPAGGWRIRIAEDHRAGTDDPGQDVTITAGGLATSSVTVRRWRLGDRLLHHIIDPATGASTDSCWRTVSVAAATCVDANAAATAALVKGRGADAWLARHGLPARLIEVDGAAATVAGWPVGDVTGTMS
ncbi:MAG TPA: FAD:protein FMN transferase [Streptosporangiaceae bacterium]